MIISLILIVLLFPPATLALISNNAVPGDATYPIKRGLEDVIYAAFSVNPVTKAWFSKARSNRRFDEISVLISQKKSTQDSLKELVDQTQTAAIQIKDLGGGLSRKQLANQLSNSIQKYEQRLVEYSKEVESSKQSQIISPIPTPVSTSNNRTTATPTPIPTPTPTLTPTPTSTPAPTPTPTHTPTTTPMPTPTPTPGPGIPPGQSLCDQIQNARLRAICEELERSRTGLGAMATQAEFDSRPTPTSTPQRDRDQNRNSSRDSNHTNSERSSEKENRGNNRR